MAEIRVERIHYGFLVAPEGTRDAGQPIPVVGYVVRHPDGLFLFDTGFAPDRRRHPRAVSPAGGQRRAGAGRDGLRPSDVDVVANCHLHADHGGGNGGLPGARRSTFSASGWRRPPSPSTRTRRARTTLPGARLEVLDGEAEPLPGIRILPTPGHSPGHQSLAVAVDGGWLPLAGQVCHDRVGVRVRAVLGPARPDRQAADRDAPELDGAGGGARPDAGLLRPRPPRPRARHGAPLGTAEPI